MSPNTSHTYLMMNLQETFALGRAGKGMASIDICYAVAAYNSVSEEHHHSYIIEFSCRTAADDVMNRLRNHLATAETKQASLYDAQTNAVFTR